MKKLLLVIFLAMCGLYGFLRYRSQIHSMIPSIGSSATEPAADQQKPSAQASHEAQAPKPVVTATPTPKPQPPPPPPADLVREVEVARQEFEEARQACLARLESDSQYLAARHEVEELDAQRKRLGSGSDQAALQAVSLHWNDANGRYHRLQQDALAADPNVLTAKRELDAKQLALTQHQQQQSATSAKR